MDKNTTLSLAPHVLKRMEYGIDIFYLLNFENDEIWTGNYTSYLVISKLNGVDNINCIIESLVKEYNEFNYNELFSASVDVLNELLEKHFLIETK